MNLDQQCCSLELSKRLKDFGVKQESLFYFVKHRKWESTDSGMKEIDPIFKIERWGELTDSEHFSAFTVPELGEMLGKRMLETYRNAGTVLLSCYGLPQFTEETEANARAAMVCYLIENKLI